MFLKDGVLKCTVCGFYEDSEKTEKQDKEEMEKIEEIKKQKTIFAGVGTMEYKDKIFNKMDKILESKKQMILYGVPGVGKTYLARTFVDKFLDNNLNSNKDISKNAQDNTKEANAHIIRDICYLIYKEGIDSEEKIIKKIDSINNKNYWKYPPTVSHKTKIKS